MIKKKRAIVWLRRDLRLSDHRAFFEATQHAEEVLPVFIIDENILGELQKDNRQVSFIQASLDEMDVELRKKGSRLAVICGKPLEVLPKLAESLEVSAVYLNRDYEPFAKERDLKMQNVLAKANIEMHVFKDQVIFEEREILNGSKEPYRVFTPYSKNWLKRMETEREVLLKEYAPNFKKLIPASSYSVKNAQFSDLGFKTVELYIAPGEKAAKKQLEKFAAFIADYTEARDYPAIDGTSRLSPHLRFGTLSIREAVRFCLEHLSKGSRTWLSELIWREFYQMILDQFPHVVNGAFKKDYTKLDWSENKDHFKAWCEGKTGYPLVDAAMRQLNETGWMHNRLRMVTAMFLTKDLLINWQWGEAYFTEQLLDCEVASNNGGWQWSASTGCDAQPYFRVMNPISQSERFDASGEFIRKFVPELKKYDSKNIHWPHDDKKLSPSSVGYFSPLVDHSTQRIKAISMFKKTK